MHPLVGSSGILMYPLAGFSGIPMHPLLPTAVSTSHAALQIPSLEDVKTPLASYQAPVGQGRAIKGKEEEEEDANVTLQAEASGHSVGGGGGRGRPYQTEQPKLLLAESETVAPCPEKRPLGERGREEGKEGEGEWRYATLCCTLFPAAGPHHPSHGHHQEEVHETTPLLPPRGQSSSHSEEEGICCSCVVL